MQPIPCQLCIVALNAVHHAQQHLLLDVHEGVAVRRGDIARNVDADLVPRDFVQENSAV